MRLGYALSSEEHDTQTLINLAKRAEEVGFSFAFISDHFHPWIAKQGESPFVWTTLGGISQETKNLAVGTAVTCPLIRIHPTTIAQAAATCGQVMEGRFMLGLGTGENLNEHIVGYGWPRPEIRREMMMEAINIIKALFTGDYVDYFGEYYAVEQAKLFTLPKNPVPILLAVSTSRSARLAGEYADGIIATKPSRKLIEAFEESGGKGKPKYGQIKVCYDEDRSRAKQMVFEQWPTGMLGGSLGSDLPSPKHFEAAVEKLTIEDLPETMPLGPNKEEHIQAIQQFFDAGYDYLYVHQVGSWESQEKFFKFYQKEILPAFT